MTTSTSTADTSGQSVPLANNLAINLQLEGLTLADVGEGMKSNCKAVKSSPQSLEQLRNLSPSALIVLFTPITVPTGFMKASNRKDQIDPFEHLGRLLGREHRRIRHVPYVNTVGLTEAHAAWMQQAAAIITVSCTSTMKRNAFALDVAKYLPQVRSDADKVPLIKLDFYSSTQAADEMGKGYATILQSRTYDLEIAQRICKILFAPHPAGKDGQRQQSQPLVK